MSPSYSPATGTVPCAAMWYDARISATRQTYQRLAATGQPVGWRQFAAAFDPPMPRRTAQRHLATHQASATTGANGQRPLPDLEKVRQ